MINKKIVMDKNFRQYLNEAQGKTLRNLINNFKKVHPYSNVNLQIFSVNIKNPRIKFSMPSYM